MAQGLERVTLQALRLFQRVGPDADSSRSSAGFQVVMMRAASTATSSAGMARGVRRRFAAGEFIVPLAR